MSPNPNFKPLERLSYEVEYALRRIIEQEI